MSKSDKLRWFAKIPWLTVIGSALLFISFISQNHYKALWTTETQRLQRSQMVIDIAELRMEKWLITFIQERRKPIPDKEMLGAYAAKLIKCNGNLLAWADARVAQDSTESRAAFEARDRLNLKADELLKNKDYEKIAELAEKILYFQTVFDIDKKQTSEFFKKINAVNEEENTWDQRFYYAYILGSLMIGAQYIIQKLKAKTDETIQNIAENAVKTDPNIGKKPNKRGQRSQ